MLLSSSAMVLIVVLVLVHSAAVDMGIFVCVQVIYHLDC